MSFNKKIYTCKVCGRTDFSDERYVHVCKSHVKEKEEIVEEEKVPMKPVAPKEDIRVNGC